MFGDSTETTNSSRSQSIYSFLGNVYVVVNLLCQVIFVFFFVFGYGNGADEVKTKGK